MNWILGPLLALLLLLNLACSVPHRTFSCAIPGTQSRSISVTETLLPEGSADENELLLSFQVIPDSTIVFVHSTTRELLYRSDDYGSTWTAVTLKADGGGLNSHGVTQLIYVPSPGPNGVLYLLGSRGMDAHTAAHGDLWISKDLGLSYRYQRIPSGVATLSVPEDSLAAQFVIATRHASRASQHSEVFLVRGFGARWTFLASGPRDGFQALVGRRLYVQRYADDSNHKYRTELVYSDDLFASTSVTLGGLKNVWKCGSFKSESGNVAFYLVTCVDRSCSQKQIYLSRDDSLALARFYTVGVLESQWGIVQGEKVSVEDVSDSGIWIKIGLFPCNRVTCRSTLYRAHWSEVDSDGTISQLLFMPVLYNADFNSRLRQFPSLQGLFYQNQFLDHQEHVRTLVTYNRGNSWQFLSSSESSKSGLHTGALRATNPSVEKREREARANLYLSTDVPGLASLIGNQGMQFSESRSQPLTYLTTNGYAFRLVGAGKLALAAISGGSALVYVNTSQDTEIEDASPEASRKRDSRASPKSSSRVPTATTSSDRFLYSLDGARTFHSCSLATEVQHANSDPTEIFFEFVSIHELGIGGAIIVALKIADDGADTISTELALFRLDFQRAFERQCASDDLESWSPLDSIGQCFMGQRDQYLRRRSDAVCSLDKNQSFLSTQATACPCTMHDYACSRCFHSPPHVLDPGSHDAAQPCTAVCFTEGMKEYQPEICSTVGRESKFYEEVVGYQVIHNNGCLASELPKGRTMCSALFILPAVSLGFQVPTLLLSFHSSYFQAVRGFFCLLIAAITFCCLWRIFRFVKLRRSRELKERCD